MRIHPAEEDTAHAETPEEGEPYAVLPRPLPRGLRRCVDAYDAAQRIVLAAVGLLILAALIAGVIERLAGRV